MAMPSAEGLFHKAIVESGSQLRASSPEKADAAARKVLAQFQVAPGHLDDLQKVPMTQLMAVLHSMGNRLWGRVLCSKLDALIAFYLKNRPNAKGRYILRGPHRQRILDEGDHPGGAQRRATSRSRVYVPLRLGDACAWRQAQSIACYRASVCF